MKAKEDLAAYREFRKSVTTESLEKWASIIESNLKALPSQFNDKNDPDGRYRKFIDHWRILIKHRNVEGIRANLYNSEDWAVEMRSVNPFSGCMSKNDRKEPDDE